MENQTETESNVPVNVVADRLNKPVGEKEAKKLEAKPVLCQGVKIEDRQNKEKTKVIGSVVQLICKHPDKDEVMNISKAQYILDKQIKEAGIWYNEDEDGNIQKGSVLANLISYYKVPNLNALIGKDLETDKNTAGFLVIKAY